MFQSQRVDITVQSRAMMTNLATRCRQAARCRHCERHRFHDVTLESDFIEFMMKR